MSAITVMLSAAFREAYLVLAPQFETRTGHRVAARWVSTVGILPKLESGEAADVAIMSASGIDAVIGKGLARERVDLARCGVGVAVRAGARRPDVSSAEALKRAVLAAGSIVYSTGPSGVHLERLFERMGIGGAIAHKVRRVQGEPAGALVARGDAEIGFQQMCELLPVAGIDFIGELPDDVQEITTFSACVLGRADNSRAARGLVDWFASPEARPIILATGMQAV
jgi:molybdate transport system substrate-binding protein